MAAFVKILGGRYETDGETVRSLTRVVGGKNFINRSTQGGRQGYRLRSTANGAPVFYNMNMIKDLYRNAVAAQGFTVPEVAAKIIDGNRVGDFIIGSIDSEGNHSISSKPMKHTTMGAARAEAERLARNVPTKSFMVLELVGTVQAVGTVWK